MNVNYLKHWSYTYRNITVTILQIPGEKKLKNYIFRTHAWNCKSILFTVLYLGLSLISSSGNEVMVFRDKRSTRAWEKRFSVKNIRKVREASQEKAQVHDLCFSLEEKKIVFSWKSWVLHRNAIWTCSLSKEEFLNRVCCS